MTETLRIIVTGGGTGGHVFPALEIAKELRKQELPVEVIFVGNPESFEEKMARESNFSFFAIPTKKLVGQTFLARIQALFYLKLAILRSIWFLVKNRPAAVIGVGGYVSAPMLIASFLLGIRRYICEQNVVPGLANKYLAFVAHRVFVSFADSGAYFPKSKVIFAGNPVRKEFFARPLKTPSVELRVLITGGSSGAKYLNSEIPQALLGMGQDVKNLRITHQTGQAMLREVESVYRRMNLRAQVLPFINDMPKAFFEHDVLISRAGATVCAEIMASGMPAVLIPYPHAKGHQKENALALERHGAAIMIEEDATFNHRLAQVLKSLYSDHGLIDRMAQRARSMAIPSAGLAISNAIIKEIV
ncbi:MAG TPA: undecaprenyldiphospho-muramoylpentapeptide beta-N-acetylglucosaminyltransferase [Myxococcota bacterium]|nr:undecaprenyldiphospho-muramoylpentapeptide beta-N-acetylglucosaminyltransferase [Myxococcota bacterium]